MERLKRQRFKHKLRKTKAFYFGQRTISGSKVGPCAVFEKGVGCNSKCVKCSK